MPFNNVQTSRLYYLFDEENDGASHVSTHLTRMRMLRINSDSIKPESTVKTCSIFSSWDAVQNTCNADAFRFCKRMSNIYCKPDVFRRQRFIAQGVWPSVSRAQRYVSAQVLLGNTPLKAPYKSV